MYLHDRQNIKPGDRVLEIGPGGQPHPLATVFLEKRFDDDEHARDQRGREDAAYDESRTVYYEGGDFPFKDKEFDYVICSHVLEHIARDELDRFISELQRVAPRGYLEFPRVFYELICFPDVHCWLMNYRDGVILFMDRSRFKSSYIHKCYHEMFYGKDLYMKWSYLRYKDFYFSGFEWEKEIRFRIVEDFSELVNEDDLKETKKYFADWVAPEPPIDLSIRHVLSRTAGIFRKIAKHLLGTRGSKRK